VLATVAILSAIGGAALLLKLPNVLSVLTLHQVAPYHAFY